MSVEEYIRGLADKELQAELSRRNKEKEITEHKRRVELHKAEREAEEVSDRAFAREVNVTYAQYQAIEDYVSDKIYAREGY